MSALVKSYSNVRLTLLEKLIIHTTKTLRHVAAHRRHLSSVFGFVFGFGKVAPICD